MNNQFKDNLKKIRKEHNLSQEQLAEELGVSRQAISKWESGTAYPEMDKIIFLCDKFNVNIDDLLHNDIKEVKSEEESKKKVNNIINDSLDFISDSVSLFSRMRFRNKIKLIIEELLIAFILMILSFIICEFGNLIFSDIFDLFPKYVYIHLINITRSILACGTFVISLIILINTFKTRYLDYYRNSNKETKKKEESSENPKPIPDLKESKIIIRDTQDSGYSFLRAIAKIAIVIIKLWLLGFALTVCAGIAFTVVLFILSFLVYNTGFFFAGSLLSTASFATAGVSLLIVILNFIFNRKSNIKVLIRTFAASVIVFGIGIGLMFAGSLSFDVVDIKNDQVVTKEYEMNNNLIIMDYAKDIVYKEEDINNIKIDYTFSEYCELEDDISESSTFNNPMLTYNISCNNAFKIMRGALKTINSKKISKDLVDTSTKLVIHANKDNIEILKTNQNQYKEEIERQRNEYNSCIETNKQLQERIKELESKKEDN